MVIVKHFSSKLVPLTTAALLILGMGILVSGVGSGAETDSVYAESASTQLSVEVPLVLSIMSNTSMVTVNAENLNTFYTGTASVVSTTNNPTGYTLTMANNDNDTDLVNGDFDTSVAGQYAGVIESITSEITVDDTGSNFTVNKWGYAKDDAPTVYKPIPQSTVAEEIKQTTGPVDSSSATVTFGTKVNGNLVAGSYEDTVVFSLTANTVPPKDITRLTSMQELAEHPEYCTNTEVGVTAEDVEDTRDHKTYDIRKLADGNCWMIDSLRLGNAGQTLNLTSADTDLATGTSSLTIPASQIVNSGTTDWSGDYDTTHHIYNRETGTDNLNGRLYGNLYTWYTATAGSGNSSTVAGVDAGGSLCPKGWHLPPNSGAGSFYNLYYVEYPAGSGTHPYQSATNMRATGIGGPEFTLSGFYNNEDGIIRAGLYGLFWSRTSYGNADARDLYMSASGALPQGNADQVLGVPIRCTFVPSS